MAATYKDGGNQVSKWKHDSKFELKQKIKSNLNQRGLKSAQIINTSIKDIIQNLPFSYSSHSIISQASTQMFIKVDNWKGVDILSMNKLPKTFNEYYKRADNWWNRYKAEWIGDYYFYPLLSISGQLYQYITIISNKHRATMELLYFMILSNIINSKVHYHRAKSQPLILDQSFIKSKHLEQLFLYIGAQHSMPWDVPINLSNGKGSNYRVIVREYVKKWIKDVLQQKKLVYNMYIATRIGHNGSYKHDKINGINTKTVQKASSNITAQTNNNNEFAAQQIQSISYPSRHSHNNSQINNNDRVSVQQHIDDDTYTESSQLSDNSNRSNNSITSINTNDMILRYNHCYNMHQYQPYTRQKRFNHYKCNAISRGTNTMRYPVAMRSHPYRISPANIQKQSVYASYTDKPLVSGSNKQYTQINNNNNNNNNSNNPPSLYAECQITVPYDDTFSSPSIQTPNTRCNSIPNAYIGTHSPAVSYVVDDGFGYNDTSTVSLSMDNMFTLSNLDDDLINFYDNINDDEYLTI